MEHKHTPGAAAEIQRRRNADDAANHAERLTWLSSDEPRWSCGTLVDAHTRHALMTQSRAVIADIAGATHE